MADPVVQIDGLRELRRDLRKLVPEVDKELRADLRDAGKDVAAAASALAPRRTGALAKSIRPSVTQRGIAIRSNLPYAPVLHWGGTIRPRGVPIKFERTEFISRAAEARMGRLTATVEDSLDRVIRRVEE